MIHVACSSLTSSGSGIGERDESQVLFFHRHRVKRGGHVVDEAGELAARKVRLGDAIVVPVHLVRLAESGDLEVDAAKRLDEPAVERLGEPAGDHGEALRHAAHYTGTAARPGAGTMT